MGHGYTPDKAHFAVARQDKLITAGRAEASLLATLKDGEAPHKVAPVSVRHQLQTRSSKLPMRMFSQELSCSRIAEMLMVGFQ